MNTNTVVEQALHLPLNERAQLAQRLLESLKQPSKADEVQEFWLSEAERRAREIDNGEVELISAQDFERRIQAKFK